MSISNRLARIPAVSLPLLLPAVAMAHPGHGLAQGSGWVHYLTDPVHVGGALLAGAVLIALRARLARRAPARIQR